MNDLVQIILASAILASMNLAFVAIAYRYGFKAGSHTSANFWARKKVEHGNN
jgi:hypothetical protein